MEVLQLDHLPDGIERLQVEAEHEGFRFLNTLISEWLGGHNQFQQQGELFLGAFRSHECIAVGGLNRDPYVGDRRIGRLRHLYVLRNLRRRGIASTLARHLLDHAEGRFNHVRLRTDSIDAARFYEALGFVAIEDETATHTITMIRDPDI